MNKEKFQTFPLLGLNSKEKMTLDVLKENDREILDGILYETSGEWYPVIDGVPCILDGPMRPDFSAFLQKYDLADKLAHSVSGTNAEDDEQSKKANTKSTFSDKWTRFKNYGMSQEHQEFLYDWYCKKLGLDSEQALRDFYRQKSRILECGPGSGFNARFMAESSDGEVFALDISDAAFTTFGNTHDLDNCHAIQADLTNAPFEDDCFDFIIADGVLHHTPNTRDSVFALYRKLAPGGQFFFYVYRKMGAARYFCDQYIREQFMGLDVEDAYKACEPITELGRELSKLNAEITLEKAIPVLGIPAGTHNVQRLFYYNFLKCFWNDAFDYETNNMVNFDWYHPQHAWQHTDEEVVGWLAELGVREYKINDANPNGISVLLTKPD